MAAVAAVVRAVVAVAAAAAAAVAIEAAIAVEADRRLTEDPCETRTSCSMSFEWLMRIRR